MSQVVFSDINTRIIRPKEDKFLTTDAEAVFQSIWRLVTTHEGEIPYFRAYGCNLKRFEQLPSAQSEQTKMIKEIRKWINSKNRGSADYFIVDKIEEIINKYEE